MVQNTKRNFVIVVIAVAVVVAVSFGNSKFFKGSLSIMPVLADPSFITVNATSDSPSGPKSAGDQLLAKFSVSYTSNDASPGEKAATLRQFDVRFNRNGVNLSNLRLYPNAIDMDVSYEIPAGFFLSANTARFNILRNFNVTAAGYNRVIERGSPLIFTLRGNIVAIAQGGSLSMQFGNIGTSTTIGLGAGDNAGDVEWSDSTGIHYWIKNPTSPVVNLNPANMVFGFASGILDSTRPNVTSVKITDTTADNNLTSGATVVVTFSEPMDPTTMISGTSLIPDNSPLIVADGKNFDLIVDDNDNRNCIALNNHDALRIVGLLCTDLGADNIVSANTSVMNSVALSPAISGQQTLTLRVMANAVLSAHNGIVAAGDILPVALTTMKDINGNFLVVPRGAARFEGPIDW